MRMHLITTGTAILLASVLEFSTPVLAASNTLACKMVDNLCYLDGGFNKLSGLSLILDTGSSLSVLDGSKASGLGATPTSCYPVQGPGGGDDQFCEYAGVTISTGPWTLQNQNIYGGPFSYVAKEDGYPTDGTLGSNIFLSNVVELNYQNAQVTLTDPNVWDSTGHGELSPISISNEVVPLVWASVTFPDGTQVEGQFLIDTGLAGTGLLISTDFQKAHPELLQQLKKSSPVIQTGTSAVGGSFTALLSRVPKLQIGNFIIQKPITSFPVNPSQDYAGLAGSIGADILSHFGVVFDYVHQGLYLKPNKNYGQAFQADMSGIRLVVNPPDYHTFIVASALDGSPAKNAGILPGDVLISTNGINSKNLSLGDVQSILRTPSDHCQLVFMRSGKQIAVDILLKSIL
jgi:hypothetical protein